MNNQTEFNPNYNPSIISPASIIPTIIPVNPVTTVNLAKEKPDINDVKIEKPMKLDINNVVCSSLVNLQTEESCNEYKNSCLNKKKKECIGLLQRSELITDPNNINLKDANELLQNLGVEVISDNGKLYYQSFDNYIKQQEPEIYNTIMANINIQNFLNNLIYLLNDDKVELINNNTYKKIETIPEPQKMPNLNDIKLA